MQVRFSEAGSGELFAVASCDAGSSAAALAAEAYRVILQHAEHELVALLVAHWRVARVLVQIEAARQWLELAIARTPLEVDVWLERGAVLFRPGKQAESYESFRKARPLSPTDYRAPYHLGISQLAAGQLEDAIASLTEAIRLDAHVPEAWFQRALAHFKRGPTARALSDVKEAIKLDPKAETLHKLERELEQHANTE